MVELLKWLYSKLSTFGEAYFQDLERDDEGVAIIDGVKLVYDIGNGFQYSDNRVRTDNDLTIDIWGRKEDYIKLEELAEKLDSLDGEFIQSCDGIYRIYKSTFHRINVGDVDKNIKRIRVQFNVKKYK